jgi:ribonuclease PH
MQCCRWALRDGIIKDNPIRDTVAAISCGLVKGAPALDLDYAEDSTAQTDANFVVTGKGGLVEVQGSAEGAPFTDEQFLALLALAKQGCAELAAKQTAAIG